METRSIVSQTFILTKIRVMMQKLQHFRNKPRRDSSFSGVPMAEVSNVKEVTSFSATLQSLAQFMTFISKEKGLHC